MSIDAHGTPSFDDIPAHIRDALTPQMREVVRHQLSEALPPDGTLEADASVDPSRRVEALRADYRQERVFWNEGGPQMAGTAEHHLRLGGVDVPIRVHHPDARAHDAGRVPAIVYFHGGGFSVGDLDTHDRIMRVIADASGAAVVGVDYTLSPEARFPQALHECAGAVVHLATNGDRYGIDGANLAVAGDSAGAMLSLGAVLLLRDQPSALMDALPGISADAVAAAVDSVKAMLLYYGGHGLRDSASGRLYGGFWDGMAPDELSDIHTSYFSDPAERFTPVVDHLAADLASPLPAAYVVGAELDPLADDARALATLLERHGQDVEFRMVPGVLHAFLHYGRMLDEANVELERGAGFVRTRFPAAVRGSSQLE